MKAARRSALLGALLSLVGCSAPYGSLHGGWSGAFDSDHQQGVQSDAFPGPAAIAAVGGELADHLRGEVELSYRQHAFGDFDIASPGPGGSTVTTVGGDGDVFAYGLFGNVHYTVDLGARWRSLIGLGIGAARVGYDVDSFGGRFVDDATQVFAGQAMAGVEVDLAPSVSASLRYRLVVAEDFVLTDELGRRFPAEYASQAVELGFVLHF